MSSFLFEFSYPSFLWSLTFLVLSAHNPFESHSLPLLLSKTTPTPYSLAMQFTFVLSLFAMISAVVALPSGHVFMRASCDIAGCVVALAPTVVGCVGAAAAAGANVIADAGCLAGAVNAAVNMPADCDQCLEEFGVPEKIEAAESKIKDVAGDVVDEAEDVADKIGDKLKDKFGSIF
ncbi:hypothetical protein FPV67DRAFT_1477413 [Lyophyllum atratum]|nr:hypothetical protein FPV67DRAFT_1477413 [Lyophyllum atratum]